MKSVLGKHPLEVARRSPCGERGLKSGQVVPCG